MDWLHKRKMSDINGKFDFERRKRSVRILVIDDDQNSFMPFKPLKKEGYDVEFWKDVEDLGKLEQGIYDIVILDIRGVGKEWCPDEEGFGIIDLLKKRNPSQIVVAYSGETFDFTKGKFYRMADDMIPKQSVDPGTCKSVIDNLICTKLSPNSLWKTIEEILANNGIQPRKINRIESKIVKVLDQNGNEQDVQDILRSFALNKDLLVSIGILIGKIFMALK